MADFMLAPTAIMVRHPWPIATYEDWLASLGTADAGARARLVSDLGSLESSAERRSACDFAAALATLGEPTLAAEAVSILREQAADDPELALHLGIAEVRIKLLPQQPDPAAIAEVLRMLTDLVPLTASNDLSPLRAKVEGYRALALRLAGHYREALATHESAIARISPRLDPIDAAILWNNYGHTLMLTGQREEAATALQKSLAIFKPLNETRYLASVAQNIGVIYMELQRYPDAKSYSLKALDWWNALPDRLLDRARTLINLGSICADLKEFDESQAYFAEAESLLPQLNNPGVENLLRNNQGALAEAQEDWKTAQERYAEALAIAQERDLPGRIWRGHLRFGNAVTELGDVTRGWDHLLQARALFTAQRRDFSTPHARRAFLAQQRDLYSALLGNRFNACDWRAEIALCYEAKRIGWTAGLPETPPSLPDGLPETGLVNGIDERAVAVEFFVTSDGEVFCFADRHDMGGISARVDLAPARLRELLTTWTAQLREFEQTPLAQHAELARRVSTDPLRELSEALLAAALPLVPGASLLLISPHGPLLDFPWNALTTEGGTPLLAEVPILLTPFRERTLLPPGPQTHTTAPQVLITRGEAPDLPAIQREVQALRDCLGPAVKAIEASDPDAIREALKTARLWHFAGHGKFDPTDPDASYLATGAGKLTVADLLAGDFRGEALELVVLAACETAKLASSEGHVVEGFIQALLATRTRAILAGGWKVRDDATAIYMEAFYKALLPGGDFARSAQSGVKALWAAGFDSHPYLWAGYQAWGIPQLDLASLARP